ncbi:MAG: glycosyltransferase [Chloroflexota bacterium]|nr:glycosyltransferase [Chloroflexota bacterium]
MILAVEAVVNLSIIIPALNEERNVAELIPKLRKVISPISPEYEIIVVDGGSTDDTAATARALEAKVTMQKEKGYGGALKEGFCIAQGDYILTLDGDLSHDPSFIPDLWRERAEAEIVVASRYVTEGSARMPITRRFLSRALNMFFASGLSLPLKDLSSGFRLYHAATLRDLELSSSDFDILQEVVIKCHSQGWHIKEVPFHYLPRTRGTSHVSLLRFGISYLSTFMRMWRLRNSTLSADYDDRAFDSIIPLQRYWQRRRYRIVTEMARGAHATLDVGCGSSRILGGLESGIGVDVQAAKLRYVRKLGRPLVNASIFALPFRDAAFDCVVCSEVIEHLPPGDEPFDELSRVLAQGGQLVIGTPDYGGIWWPTIERLYGFFAPGGYAEEHITRYTRRSLIELLERRGLVLQDCRYILRSEMILLFTKQ